MTPGTKLGPYEILAPLGAGGMGEVYRARDTKLGRDVAIKVLPEVFTHDSARMARFGREAKLLAALNHPNIAAIHGLEDSGNTHALVMELAEGSTLAERVAQGPIPIQEALPIARQIADALEYAHEHGIIHRDLKPANIKVAADDMVKILDFGLAKAMETELTAAELANSPTVSRLATQAGVLLGTAAYMSPEQAKAKPVDRRADIWAFGCVLYEMLTGKTAFHGDTVTDTLASIIKEEPDSSLLPATTPIRVRVLLQRCLQKDVRQRLQAMGDARISLEEVLAGAPEAAPMAGDRRAASTQVLRFTIGLPEKVLLGASGVFALSPDGRQLAFVGGGSDGIQRIWVRAMDSLEARPLFGSESANLPPFFWSHDSRFIVFDAAGKLKKIAVSGGPAETVCDVAGLAVGGSWNRDGVIILGHGAGGLMRVSTSGGSASPLTITDPSRGEHRHVMPSFLPDGRHFIYKRSGSAEIEGIYVGSLDAKPEEQAAKRLLGTGCAAVFVPTSDAGPAQLLFMREGNLLAQPFDVRRLELTGEAVPLAQGLGHFLDFAFFSASENGLLVYRAGGSPMHLAWLDQRGRKTSTVGEPGALYTLALSPDGTRAALGRFSPTLSLWLMDFSRGTSTRFTFGSAQSAYPVWSPDGSRIIFAATREGSVNLYQKLTSGARDEELLLKSTENKYPTSWSRDGRFLLYTVVDPKTKHDLWVLPLEGERKPFPFLRTEFSERAGQFSPDGRWVAYVSDESGREEIYVRPFFSDSGELSSGVEGKWLISTGGGIEPRWSRDGKILYYLSLDRKLMAVEVTTEPVFQTGIPKALFQAPMLLTTAPNWDVAPDSKRFLFPAAAAESAQAPFTVVSNWQAALKK